MPPEAKNSKMVSLVTLMMGVLLRRISADMFARLSVIDSREVSSKISRD